MKKSLNLILFIVLSVTGAILPANTALAAGEKTYFVPFEPCRLMNTKKMVNPFPDPETDPDDIIGYPFFAKKHRKDAVMYDTKDFVVSGGDVLIGLQGGNTTDGERCNIPSDAVAISINFTVNLPRGGTGWLRAWPYQGALEGGADGSTGTVMSWKSGTLADNAMPLSINPSDAGLRFTLRVFFNTVDYPILKDNSAHIVGDALGYYVEFTP